MLTPELTRQIVAAIRKITEAEAIYIFGSVAKGTADAGGDIDIFVETVGQTDRVDTQTNILLALGFLHKPVDVLTLSSSELEKCKQEPGYIYQSILAEGIRVYERFAA